MGHSTSLASDPLFLTVTADDFGLSDSVNRSILEAGKGNFLQSTSVMAGLPDAETGLRLGAETGTPLTFGLHFTLTSGLASAPAADIPLLADHSGKFRLGFLELGKLLLTHREEMRRQIQIELTAQLNRFDALMAQYPNLIADHIDSHQHIHSFPLIFSLLHEVAKQRHIALRVPCEPFGSLMRFTYPPTVHHVKGIIKKGILDALLKLSSRKTIKESAAPLYFGILDSGQMTAETIHSLLPLFRKLADRTGIRSFEINLHPWRVSGPFAFAPSAFLSEADHQFCQSPYREKEWNAAASEEPYRESMKKWGIIPSPFRPVLENSPQNG